MPINLKPLGENIWVQPLAHDSNTPFVDEPLAQQGALLVITKQKASCRGIVLDVGPGKRSEKGDLIPMPVVVPGDLIRWTEGSAQRLLVDGKKLYVVAGSALIGIEKVA